VPIPPFISSICHFCLGYMLVTLVPWILWTRICFQRKRQSNWCSAIDSDVTQFGGNQITWRCPFAGMRPSTDVMTWDDKSPSTMLYYYGAESCDTDEGSISRNSLQEGPNVNNVFLKDQFTKIPPWFHGRSTFAALRGTPLRQWPLCKPDRESCISSFDQLTELKLFPIS
jgi:hypothetical protein